VRKIVEKEITNKFAVYDILELFSEKNSQKLSLKIAIRDILEKCDTLQHATRNFFNDIIINLDHQIYKTNSRIDPDAHRRFKKEVDQYIDSYGNEDLEGGDKVNKRNFNYDNRAQNLNDFVAAEDYQNPECKRSQNANINSSNNNSNSATRIYNRKQ